MGGHNRIEPGMKVTTDKGPAKVVWAGSNFARVKLKNGEEVSVMLSDVEAADVVDFLEAIGEPVK